MQVEQDWIEEYGLSSGDFDITDVDSSLAEEIPSPTQIGKVYMRLILETLSPDENYVEAISCLLESWCQAASVLVEALDHADELYLRLYHAEAPVLHCHIVTDEIIAVVYILRIVRCDV